MELVAFVALVRYGSRSARAAIAFVRRRSGVMACLMVTAASATAARAQTPTGATAVAAAASTPAKSRAEQDDDAVLRPAEPDVVVVNLPTTMRLPRLKSNFRITHRFAGNLRKGGFASQLGDLFGLDRGAIIGFEYRVGVVRHVQAALYRSGFQKTIQLHGQYDAIRQRRSMPVSISALASIEGTDNFRGTHAPAAGLVVSRTVGTRLAVYLTPVWADNTATSLGGARRSTTVIGVGARVRVHGGTYLAAETAPRVAGYAPDAAAYGLSLEKRVGGHTFSLTFTNSFGTTFAQVARGGARDTLYFGFNLGRKFF